MVDYQKIVYLSSFRRLQDKAQVFPLEENDYPRTRLTHSLEVECIAEEIMAKSMAHLDNWKNKKIDAIQIIRCAALIHDLGNPPFGHYGEDVLQRYCKKFINDTKVPFFLLKKYRFKRKNVMLQNILKDLSYDFTIFDGNAQSLRIITNLQTLNGFDNQLNLTSATIGSIIKYPYDSIYAKKHKLNKIGFFHSEIEWIDFLKKNGTFIFKKRNPFATVLEAADDIANITSDLDDAVKKKILTYEVLKTEYEKYDNGSLKALENQFIKIYTKNKNKKDRFEITINALLASIRKKMVYACVSTIIDSASLESIPCSLLEYIKKYGYKSKGENIDNSLKETLNFMQNNLINKYLYTSRNVIMNELEGENIIIYLLEEFLTCIINGKIDKNCEITTNNKHMQKVAYLFPRRLVNNYLKQKVNTLQKDIYYRLKIAVDFISGMTDNYAKRIYSYLKGIK